MTCPRIAFVYASGNGCGSHAPGAVRLDTMPFAINAIIRLAFADWKVDVFLCERPLVNYHDIFSNERHIPLRSHAKATVLW